MNDRTDYFGLQNAEQKTNDDFAFIAANQTTLAAQWPELWMCAGCQKMLTRYELPGGICDGCAEREVGMEEIQ
jgi:hypothetical protein